MTGAQGQLFRFPRISTLRFEGNKINCFPREQSLSDLLHSWKLGAGNSLNLAVTKVVGQHSRPQTSQILQCCPLRDFGGNQFHCQMPCDLEVTNAVIVHNIDSSQRLSSKECTGWRESQVQDYRLWNGSRCQFERNLCSTISGMRLRLDLSLQFPNIL